MYLILSNSTTIYIFLFLFHIFLLCLLPSIDATAFYCMCIEFHYGCDAGRSGKKILIQNWFLLVDSVKNQFPFKQIANSTPFANFLNCELCIQFFFSFLFCFAVNCVSPFGQLNVLLYIFLLLNSSVISIC